MADVPKDLLEQIKSLEDVFTVSAEKLKEITAHFMKELEKGVIPCPSTRLNGISLIHCAKLGGVFVGLTVEGGTIPMNVTWVLGYPTGYEQGTFLALDMGGTNLRVCEIHLPAGKGEFDIIQSKYRMPEELKTGQSEELWEYIADCVEQFINTHHEDLTNLPTIPLGFTFSYPCTQEYIDHGILQRWTKGFDIAGVEGEDVVPLFETALSKRNLPVKLIALLNDTTGTLVASAYTDDHTRIGAIFGTGCNAAYMEDAGSCPKLAHLNLPPQTPVAINCEYGAFDNEHIVLPLTKYDKIIDADSPRPGQQAFEKMISGLYLGEIFRLALLDLHTSTSTPTSPPTIFATQPTTKLSKPYSLDASFLSLIEEDPYENLSETQDLLKAKLDITASKHELELVRRLAELIGTRAARLSACGIAAICLKKGYHLPGKGGCHVGADGSVFNKYPHFKARGAAALSDIFDWDDPPLPQRQQQQQGIMGQKEEGNQEEEDPIDIRASEDGSGVGAALIAALTIDRIKRGELVGVRDASGIRDICGEC